MADPGDREAAVLATDERCPRCSAPREPGQEYCLECGLHLPPVSGTVPSLRRSWIGRIGWYPGDWVWTAAVTLVVAVAGAAVSIVVTTHRGGSGGTTLSTPPVATTTPPPLTTTTTPAVTHPRTTPSATTTTKTVAPPSKPTNGRTHWPANFNGWTIVLGSYPVTAGKVNPLANADRAARNGLPDVGVLVSANYASLHPGYYVVFTGMYGSEAQAHAALHVASASGFPAAYPRQVSR